MRKSELMPDFNRTETFVSPWPITESTWGSVTKAAPNFCGCKELDRISTSSDRFIVAAQGAGNADGQNIFIFLQGINECLRNTGYFGIEPSFLIKFESFNSGQDIFLCFLPETFEIDQTILMTGVFQFANRGDAQFFVQGMDFFRTQPADFEHVQMPRRNRCLQRFIIIQASGSD